MGATLAVLLALLAAAFAAIVLLILAGRDRDYLALRLVRLTEGRFPAGSAEEWARRELAENLGEV